MDDGVLVDELALALQLLDDGAVGVFGELTVEFANPFVEVHLTNVDEREEWRRFSVFEGLGGMRVAGKGFDGYQAALAWLGEQRS